jgi:hypothetical protein
MRLVLDDRGQPVQGPDQVSKGSFELQTGVLNIYSACSVLRGSPSL